MTRYMDLPRFADMISEISPQSRVLIPEAFREYDLETLLGA